MQETLPPLDIYDERNGCIVHQTNGYLKTGVGLEAQKLRRHERSTAGRGPEGKESTGIGMSITGEQRQLNHPVFDKSENLFVPYVSSITVYDPMQDSEWSAWSGCCFGWMRYITASAMPTETESDLWQIDLVIPDLPVPPPAGGGYDAQDTYEVYDGSQKSSLAADAPEKPESTGGSNAWGILSIPLLGEEYVWRVRSSDDYRKTVSLVQSIFKGGPQPCCP